MTKEKLPVYYVLEVDEQGHGICQPTTDPERILSATRYFDGSEHTLGSVREVLNREACEALGIPSVEHWYIETSYRHLPPNTKMEDKVRRGITSLKENNKPAFTRRLAGTDYTVGNVVKALKAGLMVLNDAIEECVADSNGRFTVYNDAFLVFDHKECAWTYDEETYRKALKSCQVTAAAAVRRNKKEVERRAKPGWEYRSYKVEELLYVVHKVMQKNAFGLEHAMTGPHIELADYLPDLHAYKAAVKATVYKKTIGELRLLVPYIETKWETKANLVKYQHQHHRHLTVTKVREFISILKKDLKL